MAGQYTIEDFIKLNPQYKKGWDQNTNTATLTNTANGKTISWAANQGQQYGLGSDENAAGSHYINDVSKLIGSLNGPLNQPPTDKVVVSDQPTVPEYKSPFADKINAALDKYLNPTAFTYNPETDPAYQSYKQQYTKAGDNAFQNTIGDLSAMTGGRPNSWAISAASQAKNKYMEDLNNIVPTLENNAYNKHLQDYQNIANQLQTLQSMDNTSYNRNRDTIADKERLDAKNKQNFLDTISQYNDDYQARINELQNDGNPANDWQIPYLRTARQDKIETQKKNYPNTIGQFAEDYQAEINNVQNDGDPTNDWQLPYLKIARQQKLQSQAQANAAAQQQMYKNALDIWKAAGVATPEVASILGIPYGALTSDYDIASMNAAISKMNAETNAYQADTSRMNANTNAYNAQTSRTTANNNANKGDTMKYTDYVNMGKDMLTKGTYDSASGQYVRMYSPEQVKEWAGGLPLDNETIAKLWSDLGV